MARLRRTGGMCAACSGGLLLLCALLVSPARGAAAAPAADLLLENARIYTAEAGKPRAESMAVSGGRIVAIGSAPELAAFAGPATTRIDAGGRMVLPGLVDAHVHPVGGAIDALYRCNFAFTADAAQVAKALAACVAAQPGATPILGGRWGSDFFKTNSIPDPRAFLDAIASDRVIALQDDSGHNTWVNSRGLAELGITAASKDPVGGSIGRRADGEPDGLLYEAAAVAADLRLPAYTPAQYLAAARQAVATMNAFGITGMKDADAIDESLPAYAQLARDGALTLHTEISIRTAYGGRSVPLDAAALATLEDKRRRYANGELTLDTVKIYLDGVPTPARTAAMLAPYATDAEHPQPTTGLLHVDAGVLAQDIAALEKRGFRVKMHAAGDRSVRTALDAIATVRSQSPGGPAHEIAHAGYIDPADIGRFARLGAVADMSPVLWHPSSVITSVIGTVGEPRGSRYWPARDLLDAGARIVAGSDWPSAVPSANPWVGIEAFVTRADPYGETAGVLWKEQAIRLEEALGIYTANGAAALGRERDTGTLAVGKLADFVVLDRDLFAVPATDIGATRVLSTWFAGRKVYENPAAAP